MGRVKNLITDQYGEIPEMVTVQRFMDGDLDLPEVDPPEGFEQEAVDIV